MSTTEAVLEKTISPDGTPIAFWRSGHGPALVMVHGATADHLLVGSANPPEITDESARLAAAMPDARVEALDGQGHVAMLTGPSLFTTAVLSFLAGPVLGGPVLGGPVLGGPVLGGPA
jgi:hypothetical protein